MNLTISGRQVTVDDSFQNLSREEQDATVEEIAKSLPSDTKEASGAVAGFKHGLKDALVDGPAETLKQYAGVGPGRKDDPNYVGTDFFGGSANPTKWNYGQLPQILAENAPGMAAGAAAAAGGAKTAKTVGLGKKAQMLAALAAAGLYGFGSSAGDTAKEAAVARTGDANAETNSSDLTRGAVTAAAANAVGALAPTRLIPGMNKLSTVGAQGALDAAKRYLGTTAIGAGSGAASDVITQAGTKVGTDAPMDWNRSANAGVAGGLTSGVMAAPQLAGDTVRAGNMREFGGANAEPTKNYATRLATAGEGLGGLGNSKRDAQAHEMVKSDLRNELSDASRGLQLGPDADNALQRIKSGDPITPRELDMIESQASSHPDGANAAYLARTLRVAQLAQEKGTYKNDRWAGGVSGAFDANIGYMLNPFRSLTGAAASGLGIHLLGTSSPSFAAAAFGSYAGARALDGMTGMRSPAKSFADHFADHAAQLRLPQTPQAAPPAPPPGPAPRGPWSPAPPAAPAYGPTGVVTGTRPAQPPPGGPWGPRPGLGLNPTGPVAGPTQGPPAPTPAPQPAINPMALMMLKQKLKQGLPAEPEPTPAPAGPDPLAAAKAMLQQRAYLEKVKANSAVPEPAAPAPINPLMLPKDITGPAKTITSGLANVTAMRQGQQAKDAVAALPSPLMDETPIDVTRNPAIGKRAAQLLSAANALKKYTAVKEEPAAADLGSAVTADVTAPKTMADVLRNASEAAKPKTIKKSNGKVETEAPTPPKAEKATFEPFDEETMIYPEGISAKQYGEAEAQSHGTTSERYKKSAERTAADWIKTTNQLSGQFPGYKHSFKATLRHLIEIGSDKATRRAAIEHFASHVPDDVGNAMREAYK